MKRFLWLASLVMLAPVTVYAGCNDDDRWICTLANNYEPNPNLNKNTFNTSPQCGGDANPAEVRKIQEAFDAIPATLPRVKHDLCEVKHVFIASAPHSWGRFNDPMYHPTDNPGSSYIAITRSDLNRPFTAKQDDQLNSLAPGAGGFHTGAGGNAAHPKFGLIFALAHELGHIKWHQQYPAGPNKPGIPCYDAAFGPSWQNNTEAAKQNRWTEFGVNNLGRHPSVPFPNNAGAADIISIYNSGFATALAAANPEEDFVQAYAVGVVHAACPGCAFSFNTALGIIALSKRPAVEAKIGCVAANFF